MTSQEIDDVITDLFQQQQQVDQLQHKYEMLVKETPDTECFGVLCGFEW